VKRIIIAFLIEYSFEGKTSPKKIPNCELIVFNPIDQNSSVG